MRIFLIAAAATGLVACQTTESQPAQRSAAGQTTYDQMLAGKSAGPAQKCLMRQRANDMVVIDDDTILYRDGGTTYVNRTLGSCSRLAAQKHALVTRSIGMGLCRGDIATVVNTTTGVSVGSCALGEFIPYRSAS